MSKPIALKWLYDELLEMPAHVGWGHLLRLMRQQLERGESSAKNLAYYARPMILDYREEAAKINAQRARSRGAGSVQPLGTLLKSALDAQG